MPPAPFSRLQEREQRPAHSPACREEAMPGPLSRLRERVGVRVFSCRKDSLSCATKGTQGCAET